MVRAEEDNTKRESRVKRGEGMEKEEAAEMLDAMFVLWRDFGRRFRREREPLNITPTQYHALSLIDRRGTATLMEMAGMLQVAGPTATRAIEALAQKELLIKDRDPQDRRMIWLRLSDAGKRLLQKERDAHIRYFQTLADRLPEPEQQQFLQTLRTLAKTLE